MNECNRTYAASEVAFWFKQAFFFTSKTKQDPKVFIDGCMLALENTDIPSVDKRILIKGRYWFIDNKIAKDHPLIQRMEKAIPFNFQGLPQDVQKDILLHLDAPLLMMISQLNKSQRSNFFSQEIFREFLKQPIPFLNEKTSTDVKDKFINDLLKLEFPLEELHLQNLPVVPSDLDTIVKKFPRIKTLIGVNLEKCGTDPILKFTELQYLHISVPKQWDYELSTNLGVFSQLVHLQRLTIEGPIPVWMQNVFHPNCLKNSMSIKCLTLVGCEEFVQNVSHLNLLRFTSLESLVIQNVKEISKDFLDGLILPHTLNSFVFSDIEEFPQDLSFIKPQIKRLEFSGKSFSQSVFKQLSKKQNLEEITLRFNSYQEDDIRLLKEIKSLKVLRLSVEDIDFESYQEKLERMFQEKLILEFFESP